MVVKMIVEGYELKGVVIAEVWFLLLELIINLCYTLASWKKMCILNLLYFVVLSMV